MKHYIEQRVKSEAEYIAMTGATVRKTAKKFGTSKSTVHKDMCVRLPDISMALYRRVRLILDENMAERHIRGGMATRRKYLMKKGVKVCK